ncbi:MAG: type IV pilus assembly protein PilM [Phycisphaerae bacterium]|nr:type IV pilus assembly protein PilM [Phycisphaerae bacterium]
MAAVNSVWGIDIGQCALKAMKLVEQKDGQLQVEAFEVVEHSEVLSQPEADAPLIIATSIDEFLRRVDVSDSKVAVSVLGQSSFTRFVKLPPVEKSKIPDIVRFEAEQQIPFPIEEVIWRYQTFQDEDSPEVEAGIFAMKQVDVAEMLTYYANAALEVDIVQMAPLALYNFMKHDDLVAPEGATLLADVGADKTHLVVADGNRIWTRTIQIGGNNFTEALVKSFKLSFAKAEKLKRTAAASKYARQIFQVMRPVFADLVQEIQRSIGYYTQLNRDSRFKSMIGMGNGFRLPGMQKYLEQNLNMPVTRIEGFKGLSAAPENLKDHILSLGVIYGLCLQGIGAATVHTNLLPETIAKKRLWGKKRPMFIAAAACLLLAAGIFVFRSYADRSVLQAPDQQEVLHQAQRVVDKLTTWDRDAGEIKAKVKNEESQIVDFLSLRAYSRIWPAINARVAQSLRLITTSDAERQILAGFPSETDPEKRRALAGQVRSPQAILELIAMLPAESAGEGEETPLRTQLIEELKKTHRPQRDIIYFESLTSEYMDDLTPKEESDESEASRETAMRPPGGLLRDRGRTTRQTRPTAVEKKRGFEIMIRVRTPLPKRQADFRIGQFKDKLKEVIDSDANLEVVGMVGYKTIEAEESSTPSRRSTRVTPTPLPGRLETTPGQSETDIPDEYVDPLFSDESKKESMENDTRYILTLRVAVTGKGLKLPESMATRSEEPTVRSRWSGRSGR